MKKVLFSKIVQLGYFKNRPDLFKQYQRIINKIDIDSNENLSEQSIALHIGGDSWDYPFWVMLKDKFGNEHPYFFHLVKDNIEIINKDSNYPKYIIFENRLSNNLINIKKSYTNVILGENFSLMKIINKG